MEGGGKGPSSERQSREGVGPKAGGPRAGKGWKIALRRGEHLEARERTEDGSDVGVSYVAAPHVQSLQATLRNGKDGAHRGRLVKKGKHGPAIRRTAGERY